MSAIDVSDLLVWRAAFVQSRCFICSIRCFRCNLKSENVASQISHNSFPMTLYDPRRSEIKKIVAHLEIRMAMQHRTKWWRYRYNYPEGVTQHQIYQHHSTWRNRDVNQMISSWYYVLYITNEAVYHNTCIIIHTCTPWKSELKSNSGIDP